MSRFAPLTVLAATVALTVTPASSATQAELDTLFEAIGTPELIATMRTEGLEQSDELRQSMFPERANGWRPIASSIYDTERMEDGFRTAFDQELSESDVTPLLAFFASDLGREIIALELSAREALLDDDVEEAAKEAYADLAKRNPERQKALEGFVDANDLIEMNVAGALNASLAFYRGLADGGSFDLTEDVILRDVWEQEPEIRTDTVDWMMPYLAMAYEPLSADELAAYEALSLTKAGRDLNRALFSGFDVVFNRLSYSLGSAASRFVQGDDI
ncbi:DUF2059 domain-containing protein [uncultured Boseongicola sp.]|jgi:hypothetical protein|uniref:DUF2059 domain-containing protein n=1 Tax=uncultured Boseongicola sp. TaxID=1648499 RepID=UPI00260300CA|nr:DUF2059 domain-containing protein [uncultured Boseongicola sp.]